MKNQISMIFTIVLIIIVALFVIMNLSSTEINFGVTKVQLPLIIVLLITLLLGSLINFLLSTFGTFKNHSESKKIKNQNDKKIADYEKQISSLKENVDDLNKKLRNNISKQEVGRGKEEQSTDK